MAICEKIRRKSTRVCIGSYNKKIELYARNIAPPAGESVDYTEVFSVPIQVWSMIETENGLTIFDDTNVERVVTHSFFVRYIPGITFEKWIKFPLFGNPNYYDVLRVENFQEENWTYRIRSNLRGNASLPVNES